MRPVGIPIAEFSHLEFDLLGPHMEFFAMLLQLFEVHVRPASIDRPALRPGASQLTLNRLHLRFNLVQRGAEFGPFRMVRMLFQCKLDFLRTSLKILAMLH